MITDQDADKIAGMVFDKLVARWEERSAEVKKRKEERERDKEEEKRLKKESRARKSKVRQRMVAALRLANQDLGGFVFEHEWRERFASLHNMLPGALRVAFSRHRQALIDAGEVIDDNGRFLARDIRRDI
jgi:hypothetical protein